MVQFQYLADGIRIRNQWYPVLKMDWVEGFTVNDLVRQHVDKPQVMYRLAQMWIKLSRQLRLAGMAHGDLQHGNVLLVPGEKASQLSLRLIDYDGMHIPALDAQPSGELGHPNYQHPERLREGTYRSEVDRFSHLVIYTALRCLTVGGRPLWTKYDNGENLLFRAKDFAEPAQSELLADLWQLEDQDIRHLLGHLVLGSQTALHRVVMLDEVVGGEGRPLALTAGQERQLLDYLPAGAAPTKTAAMLPRVSLEALVARMEEPLEPASGQPGTASYSPPSAPATSSNGQAPAPSGPHPFQHFKDEWTKTAIVVFVAAVCELMALAALPRNEPGAFGLLGVLHAVIAMAAVPLAVGLLLKAGLELMTLEATVALSRAGQLCERRARNAVTSICCRCSLAECAAA